MALALLPLQSKWESEIKEDVSVVARVITTRIIPCSAVLQALWYYGISAGLCHLHFPGTDCVISFFFPWNLHQTSDLTTFCLAHLETQPWFMFLLLSPQLACVSQCKNLIILANNFLIQNNLQNSFHFSVEPLKDISWKTSSSICMLYIFHMPFH